LYFKIENIFANKENRRNIKTEKKDLPIPFMVGF